MTFFLTFALEFYSFFPLDSKKLDSLSEKTLVLLQFGAGRKIDVVHFGVFVANGDNETANEFGINCGFDVNVTGANDGGNGGGDLFLLGFAQSGGGGDFHWGETGFGLHDSAVKNSEKKRPESRIVAKKGCKSAENMAKTPES